MIPAFAVVGHPNKGKSSIVATLAEDDNIAISPAPGTTRHAHRHTFSIDGEPQYVLIDTPGFQRARGVLDWLEIRATGAHERSGLVEEFVRAYQGEERFHDECELLRPIVEGAGILYVVDGAKPYGPEYEMEMQVLRWTGCPRMALINIIGPGDHVDEWRRALGQYFSIVRVFDAVHADFGKRVALLRGFAELEEAWRPAIEKAVGALEAERRHRRERSAAEIAECLIETMGMTERDRMAEDADRRDLQDRLTKRLQTRIQARERDARDAVQNLYLHKGLRHEEISTSQLLTTELFTKEGWELFGLPQKKLVLSGMFSAAVAGGSIDAVTGAATFMLGTGIGAVVGGVGVWLGADRLARVKILNQSLGGRVLQIGPVTAPNFPWVLLGRAWIHHRMIAERNHARRGVMSLALSADLHLMNVVPDDIRRKFAKSFKELATGNGKASTRQTITAQVSELLNIETHQPP